MPPSSSFIPFSFLLNRSTRLFLSKLRSKKRRQRSSFQSLTATKTVTIMISTANSGTASSSDNPTPSQHLFKLANQFLLGRKGHKKQPSLAITYYKGAANLGHTQALGVLGFCHEFGLGVDKDFEESERLYLEAAKRYQDGLAMARLAFLRKYGRPNVKIDRAEAEEWADRVRRLRQPMRWIVEAATLDNNAAAQYALGVYVSFFFFVSRSS